MHVFAVGAILLKQFYAKILSRKTHASKFPNLHRYTKKFDTKFNPTLVVAMYDSATCEYSQVYSMTEH